MDPDLRIKFCHAYYASKVWENTYYHGIPTAKCPLDLWIYQELISIVKPKLIVEFGFWLGGSTKFIADQCHLLKTGHVLALDKVIGPATHPRINFHTVSSYVNNDAVELVNEYLKRFGQPVMFIDDASHTYEDITKGLELYGPLVPSGSYYIVEDTNLEPPYRAVQNFLKHHQEFVLDYLCEKFFLTLNPSGYLLRR